MIKLLLINPIHLPSLSLASFDPFYSFSRSSQQTFLSLLRLSVSSHSPPSEPITKLLPIHRQVENFYSAFLEVQYELYCNFYS